MSSQLLRVRKRRTDAPEALYASYRLARAIDELVDEVYTEWGLPPLVVDADRRHVEEQVEPQLDLARRRGRRARRRRRRHGPDPGCARSGVTVARATPSCG